ncbi:MAG: phospholipid carrier-dependent glycosyltransferase, partial [Acidobacteria bacterium]|nr:phospholipid carrier-dependent glycosyltransferase [Acidobacteriota bacterium]
MASPAGELRLKHAWWIAPVLAGGLLRFCGISFGCPILSNLYIRPDESLVVVSGVELLKNAGAPGTFAYPALFIEMAGIVYHLMSSDPPVQFGLDPTPFFVAARVMAALFGTATILLVYGIARHVMSRPWACLAAAAYAAAPLAVRDAHFGVTDIPSVCFQTAVVWLVLRYVEADPSGKARALWGATAALALSMATKYAGSLLVSVLLSAL